VRRRLSILIVLALVGIATAGVTLSNSSFTTESTTSLTATSSPITMDTLAVEAGNGQSATAGSAVAVAPKLHVTDKNGNPVSGLAVTFVVASGGGSATSVNAVTNASGFATVGSWRLGTTAGANTLSATIPGVIGSPLTFTATGLAGAGTRYVVTSSNYGPVAGTAVTVSAQFADQYGNPVATSGRSVAWTKTGTGGALAPTTSVTNSLGVATTTFTTAALISPYTVKGTTATVTGTSASIVSVAGAATKIAISAGNNQSTIVGTPVTILPSVKVSDVNNNAVPGAAVTFVVATGGGSATGLNATTNASGVATVGSWTLGTVVGANKLTVTQAGLTGSPITFTATAKVGPATRYTVTSSNYSPLKSTYVTITAQRADQYGNAVTGAGFVVAWTKTGTGGSFATATSTTLSTGRATVNFTVGSTAGIVHTVTGTTTAITGTSPNITTR
jgi:adhesin/invasin